MIRAAALLALCLALAACGQKGPLKLPDSSPPKVPQPVPAAPPSSP
jgi:predicted small lipoprotein YifL